MALFCAAGLGAQTVTLLHFSDYHSHALPFYSGERSVAGGIARAVGYLKKEKRAGALVFSGGDMVNIGAPAWSDKYRCAEWPWLNGVLDAMALGNHDPDYGLEVLDRCREQLRYPIISANTAGFQCYDVFTRHGIRIGVFAIAGPDFKSLVHAGGLTFSDSVAAARDVVRILRDDEKVDAVVMIGHEHLADDFALAKAVPGIDLIFGTHSHLKRDFELIPETRTHYISPWQYLTYVSRVEMTFKNHRLMSMTGHLVPIDERMKPDAAIEARVEQMEQELERDPQYTPLFAPIGKLQTAMPLDDFARYVMRTSRDAVHADIALSTASSFRQPLPAGTITMELLRNALPYDNEIVVFAMTGERLTKVLAFSDSERDSDSFAYTSGTMTLDPAKTYRVATTEFLARVAPGYRELFKDLTAEKSGLRVRDEVRKALASAR